MSLSSPRESTVHALEPGGITAATRAAFIAWLTERGYAQQTLVKYQAALARFSRWLDDRSIPSAVGDELVQDYLKTVLPTTRVKRERAVLHHLMAFIDNRSATPSEAAVLGPIDQRLLDYQHYLVSVCGLAPRTCNQRLRYVRAFLQEVVDPTLEIDHMCAAALINYVSDYGRTHKPGSTQCLAKAIRSYLRFAQLQGHDTRALRAVVPTIAPWPRAALPTPLDERQLERFFGAFNRSTPSGQRDFAMARCLVDLGLRASEVAALRLEDIHWQAGYIHLAAGKTRRAARLPLLSSTGEAIAAYVQQGRANSPSRAVFVRLNAPYDASVTAELVRGAMRRAFTQAGLPPTWTGTHRLRQTTATRMLQNGASLKAIADVLRHQSLNTAKPYTQVDLAQLRIVAMPWPEATP